jgi:hypothetical protein
LTVLVGLSVAACMSSMASVSWPVEDERRMLRAAAVCAAAVLLDKCRSGVSQKAE